MSDVTKDVMNLVAEQMGMLIEELKVTDSLVHDLGADTLHIVELIMNLEEKFEIEILDEDFDKIDTIQDVINYILDSQ